MSSRSHDEEASDDGGESDASELRKGLRIAGVAIPKSVPLAIKLGGVYVKYKLKARKAAKSFEETLVAQGMDPEMASELAEVYKDGSRFEGLD